MNCTVSLFGDFGHGYFQYPWDGSSIVMQKLASKSNGKTQLAIHREGSLMYHCYLRAMENDSNQYFGFCLLLNGVMITDLKELFTYFEEFFSTLVMTGDVVRFQEDGFIIPAVDNPTVDSTLMEKIIGDIRRSFGQFDSRTVSLPPVHYGVSVDEVRIMSIDDDFLELQNTLNAYSYVIIVKNQDFDSLSFRSYRGILNQLKQEKDDLLLQNETHQNNLKKLERQKKQYRYVIFGCILLFFAMLKLLDLNKNLDNARAENDTLNTENSALSSNIDSLRLVISRCNNLISDLRNHVVFRDTIISALRGFHNYNYSFIPQRFYLDAVDTDGDPMQIGFSYLQHDDKFRIVPCLDFVATSTLSDSVETRWTTPSSREIGRYYYRRYALSPSIGSQTKRFAQWHDPEEIDWAVGLYTVELWCDSICLGKKDFYVYE